jgi:transposase InsO family protein
MPAASTIGEILKRRGLSTTTVRRARGSKEARAPFANITGPNATWCVDFKGHFKTGDGQQCYPLTIVDAYSRYLVRCEGVLEPNGREVQRIFDSAFQEYGLPAAIRSDNGPPFASVGAGGLTPLSAWWIRLGIQVERITPGKPQENGRQERFHRTLKAETTKPAAANLRAQQRTFDLFRRAYNEERPHEALGQVAPSTVYLASARRYPCPLVDFSVAPWDRLTRVDKDGYITWDRRRLFVSTALALDHVELRYREIDPKHAGWDVVFGPLSIGLIEETSRGPIFKPSKGRMNDRREVSVMPV